MRHKTPIGTMDASGRGHVGVMSKSLAVAREKRVEIDAIFAMASPSQRIRRELRHGEFSGNDTLSA